MLVIDLFSGCGGSAVGFRQIGFKIAVAVDINKVASETFKINFPETVVLNQNITTLSGRDLLKAAGTDSGDNIILLGCPPCQGYSTARRAGQRLSEPRNMLVFEFARIIREIKPKFFIMENVPGLANGIGKEIFSQVIRKIKSAGYSNYAYKVIDTADYGVPQRRKRLLFIGTNDSKITISLPAPTNADTNSNKGLLKPWNTVKDAISDLPSIHAGEKHSKDKMHASANLSELNIKRLKSTPKNGGSRNSWPDELVLECHKNVNGYKDIYGRMRWDSPSPTITGGCCMLSKGRFGHPEQNRAISLREAARLQTFPDNFIFSGNFGDIASQIGNAVPPLLTRRIGYLIQRLCKNSRLPDRNFIHSSLSISISP